VSERRYTDEEVEAAVAALSEPGALAEAARAVARAAPALQRILAEALGAGGWFGESHESQVLKATTTPDEEARITAVRTLAAEDARMGMMVGVAVGWALAEKLSEANEKE
jgi:transposase-like protein